MDYTGWNRVMVIGCCGAGKSTFAGRLAQIIPLPIIHLDQEYWQPDWNEPEKEVWHEKVRQLSLQEKWIMDGNYGSSLDIRLQKADAIVFLDYATMSCIYRVSKRIWKYKGTVRPDMPEGCRERWDWNFMHYVAVFNLIRRPSILKILNTYKDNVDTVILKNDGEVSAFFEKISQFLPT